MDLVTQAFADAGRLIVGLDAELLRIAGLSLGECRSARSWRRKAAAAR